MTSYVVVDFLKLDPKLFEIGEDKENGFGGYSATIRYGGKRLYVRYNNLISERGIMRWGKGRFTNYTVSFNVVGKRLYADKADEIDSFFKEEYGLVWKPIIRRKGVLCHIMNFKIPMRGRDAMTKFFGKFIPKGDLVLRIPKMSHSSVLALWDTVSVGDSYGAVIRPKAIQINVCRISKVIDDVKSDVNHIGDDDDDYDDVLVGCLC